MAGTNPTYTEAAEEALARATSVTTFITTVQFYNPTVGTLSYVNGPTSLTATLEDGVTSVTFSPLNFVVSEPKMSVDSVPELTINCDAISGDFLDFWAACSATQDKTVAKIRAYIASSLSAPMQREPITFTVGTPAIKGLSAQLKGVFADLNNAKFLNLRYGKAQFSALTN